MTRYTVTSYSNEPSDLRPTGNVTEFDIATEYVPSDPDLVEVTEEEAQLTMLDALCRSTASLAASADKIAYALMTIAQYGAGF